MYCIVIQLYIYIYLFFFKFDVAHNQGFVSWDCQWWANEWVDACWELRRILIKERNSEVSLGYFICEFFWTVCGDTLVALNAAKAEQKPYLYC